MRSTLASILLGLLAALPILGQDAQPNESRQQQLPFEFLFSIRGVEFSEDQQAKREQLRQQYAPRLSELQREQKAVFTAEQRRAWQAAIRQARDAGKDGQELRQAAEVAAKLTEEQKKQLSKIQKTQTALVAKIQDELRALLTDQQQVQLRRGQGPQKARPRIAPTHPDVKYGPHRRNVMDVWLAKSDKPTPVLVSIHGGGFHGGNKGVEAGVLRECLDSGISVVAITYRLSDEAIAPAQFLDSARAIQFIRHNAREWNLDPACE